jgi:hypothetical protein
MRNTTIERPQPSEPDMARVAAAREKYRGEHADAHIARNLSAALDGPIDEAVPSLGTLSAVDYETAHEDAEQPERWDLCS